MSRREKLLRRFLGRPNDLTWDEFTAALGLFGYRCEHGGGSRRAFIRTEGGDILFFHEPHPRKIVLACYIRQAVRHLKENGLLE
jgi:hypothetical protein